MITTFTLLNCSNKSGKQDPWADNRHEVYILHPPFPLNHERFSISSAKIACHSESRLSFIV
jgi:hypothetical protein